MIIFVYGDDPLFPKRKVVLMKARFEEKYDTVRMNSAHFSASGNGIELSEVISAIQTPPFLGEKRFVVLEGLLDGLLKPDSLKWAEALRVPDSTILVFLETLSVDRVHKHPLFVALKKSGTDLHDYGYSSSNPNDLSTFIRDEVQEYGATIDSQAVQLLIARCGASPSRLFQELTKLLSFIGTSRIDKSLVDTQVLPLFTEQMFQFIDRVADGGRPRAFELLLEQREAGLEDAHLFAMLIRQSRILIRVRVAIDQGITDASALASELALSPYQVRKCVTQVKRFNLPSLAKLHTLAFSLEGRLKRGKVDYTTALERLLLAWTANP